VATVGENPGVEFVHLTGVPRASLGSRDAVFLPDKRYQLLAYLAYGSDWIGRERASFLFWPDTDTAGSRQNLRGLLRRLHTLDFQPNIETNKHQVRWDVPTDVAVFEDAVHRGELDVAIAAYRGNLMEGLGSEDDGEFGEWLEIERERLRSSWRAVALQRLASLEVDQEHAAARLVRRLLVADPLDEEALRVYMVARAGAGQPNDAHALYQEFAVRLERDMGLEPTSDTVAALELVRGAVANGLARSGAGAFKEAGSRSSASETSWRQGSLPFHATTFVGRRSELSQIASLLSDPATRLVTLVGAGGIGKTRLALKAAEVAAADFGDGIVFVPLEAVSSGADVGLAIARALGIDQSAGQDPIEQVRAVVAQGNVLIVLDNFENVLAADSVVNTLLAACRRCTLLVTSRERLGLEAEHILPVAGLDFPTVGGSLADVRDFGAVALFLERARRVRPSFTIEPPDLPDLLRLMALTDGMPLAIELAAAWARALPLKTMVSDIEGRIDTLSSSAADAIERHRSVRETFEQSWRLLGEAERSAMRRIAVFRTAVSPEAAAFVASASRTVLAALVDKSLLRLSDGGRYDRHPLLHAFSREKLAADSSERELSERRHAGYYLRFLRERVDRARGPEPARVLRELGTELPEILAAARRSRERGKRRQFASFMFLLDLRTGYFQAHGYTAESIELLGDAAQAAVEVGWLEVGHDLRARVGDALWIHRGDSVGGLAQYKHAVALARRSGNATREAVFLSLCGAVLASSDPGAAWVDLDAALALAKVSGDDLCLATVYEMVGYTLVVTDQLESARGFYQDSVAATVRLERSGTAEPYDVNRRRFHALVNLGHVENELGSVAESLRVRREALNIARDAGNPIWEAHAHLELGEMLATSGDHEAAIEHLTRALAIYREKHVTAHLVRLESIMNTHGYHLPAQTVLSEGQVSFAPRGEQGGKRRDEGSTSEGGGR
jgi:predicted ATPase/DNA-binding SARP family transcriptional activator